MPPLPLPLPFLSVSCKDRENQADHPVFSHPISSESSLYLVSEKQGIMAEAPAEGPLLHGLGVLLSFLFKDILPVLTPFIS